MLRFVIRNVAFAAVSTAIAACSSNQIGSSPSISIPPPSPAPITNLKGETLTAASLTSKCHSHFTGSMAYVTVAFSGAGNANGPLKGTFHVSGAAMYFAQAGAPGTNLKFKEQIAIESGGSTFAAGKRHVHNHRAVSSLLRKEARRIVDRTHSVYV